MEERQYSSLTAPMDYLQYWWVCPARKDPQRVAFSNVLNKWDAVIAADAVKMVYEGVC